MFGPRFQAAVATLSVRNRISRRDVVELCEQLFGSRISTGTVDAILCRVADALVDPCEDLLERLRASQAVHMDETGWRTAGQRRALWGIFDQRHAYLHVAADRHEDHAKSLLADTKAVVTSDRWWAYSAPAARTPPTLLGAPRTRLQSARRRHGRRERVRRARPARLRARVLGLGGLPAHPRPPPSSRPRSAQLQREFKPIVRRYAGKSPRYKYCRGIARNLLKAWPALWTFARHPGVEPTNNHAERALRGAVIYRKLCLGSQ